MNRTLFIVLASLVGSYIITTNIQDLFTQLIAAVGGAVVGLIAYAIYHDQQ